MQKVHAQETVAVAEVRIYHVQHTANVKEPKNATMCILPGNKIVNMTVTKVSFAQSKEVEIRSIASVWVRMQLYANGGGDK